MADSKHENWYALEETIDREHLGNYAQALRGNVETPEDLVHATVAVANCAVTAMLKELDIKPELMYLISVLVFRRLNDMGDGFTSVTNYDDMLDPSNRHLFEKTISREAFEDLQEKAQELLDTVEKVHPAMRRHWELIVQGRVPFGYSVAEEVFETDPKNYVKREEEEVEVDNLTTEQPLQDGEALADDICPDCGCSHCVCE